VEAGVLAKENTLTMLRLIATGMPDSSRPCFEISDETRQLLVEYVASANALLKKHFDIPTDEYGYDKF
jgi:hypothetical protein